MDVLRSCYSRPCRFYANQTIPTRIVWYFCDDDAQPLGKPTVFWPYSQVKDVRNVNDGIGEDTSAPIVWRNGSKPWPSLVGDHSEGTIEDYLGLSSAPASARGEEPQLSDRADCEDHTALELAGGMLFYPDRIPLVGGEAESGNLTRILPLVGGEAEGGTLTIATRLVGGEAEGGTLTIASLLSGGEAEGGIANLSGETLIGGEAEGGTLILSGLSVSGGEAEAGLLASMQLIGGEAEGGFLESMQLIGGEAENAQLAFALLSGGEVEGGKLTPAPRLVGGEAEGGWLSKDIPLIGGEAEGGTLTYLPSVRLDGGEADSGLEFQATILADLWLDATQLVLSNGDPVSLWSDRSGNGNDATQGTTANRPTYDPVGGAAPCVLFGFGLRLLLTSPIQGGSGWTTYVVMRPKVQNMVISSVTGSSTNAQSARPGVTWKVGFGSDINVSFDTLSVWGLAWPWDATRTDLISCRRNGLNWSLQADGYFPAGYNPVSSTGPLVSVDTINAVGPVGGQYLGWIYEILCFNRSLTDEEDHSIVNYLGRKWRVPGF